MDGSNDDAIFNLGVISFKEGDLASCLDYFQDLDSNELLVGQKQAISDVLHTYLGQLITSHKDSLDRTIMTNMQYSDSWMMKILYKSGQNDITFEEQVQLDLVYIKEQGFQKVK